MLIPLWNAYSFFVTYARIYDGNHKTVPLKPEAVIDQWMLSLLNKLIKDVQEGMDDYDLSMAVEPFVGFVDQLTNWYIRRSRRRFWDDTPSVDRDQAFATLFHVLIELVKIAAPFIPFLSEAIYHNLRREGMSDSVHLCDFPAYQNERRDETLEQAMAVVQTTVSLGHSLRKENKLKVRQPLAAAHVASEDKRVLNFLKDQQHLIAEELNVKEIVFDIDEKEFVVLKAKPNFRILGKKVGKLMRAVQTAIDTFTHDQLTTLLNGGEVVLLVEGENVTLTPEDVQVERHVREGLVAANAGLITIALDTNLSEVLLLEGLAREVINKVNTMRREAGFEVTDRIHMELDATDRLKQCFDRFGPMINAEVLAVSVKFGPSNGTAWDLNGENTIITLKKA